MKIPQHHVIIRVSSETDHIIKTNVVDQHGKRVEFIIPIIKDDSNALKYNRIYGEVVHVPDKVGDVEPYYLDYPGFPTPARYRDSVSCSRLSFTMTRGTRMLTDEEKKRVREFYQCTTYQDKYVRAETVDIPEGSKAYFHYLSITDQNYMGKDDKGKLFKIPCEKIICYVQDREIHCVNGYVLIDKHWNEDFQDIEIEGMTIKAKLTASGLVAGVTETPEPLMGHLRFRGESPTKRENTYVGDMVLFSKNSEWENTIEGHLYYTMREWDIIAYYDKVNKIFIPDGDYVKIRPSHPQAKLIIAPEQYLVAPEMGEVVDVGDIPDIGLINGDYVHYNRKSIYNVHHKGFDYVRYKDISMVTDPDVMVKVKGKQLAPYRKLT